MAESILVSIVGEIFKKMGSMAFQELVLVWGFKDELKKLQQTLSAIQAVLVDAEEQQSKSNAVKDWVSKLKDVLFEIDDLIDECGYDALRRQVMGTDTRMGNQVHIFFSKFMSDYKMAHKIKDVRKRLKPMNEDRTQFSFSERVLDTSVHDEFKKKRETYSYILDDEVIGRNNDKEAIMKFLTQSVELKLWVCVSEDFDVKIIVRKIIESVTQNKSESFLQLDSLANELRKQIDGKKYLLVMDDVWNEDHEKWVGLKRLLMGGAKGSRILITIHGQRVAKTFNTTFFYSLQNLDECNSWKLFKKMTFLEGKEEERENSDLIKIGKDMVAKLRGVPLVIRTIKRLLREKKSQKFWLSFKDKELYQVMGQGENADLNCMQSILELSYKYPPSSLKQCFLYCALFPKDYEIQNNDLILQWRAQGFISPNDKDELNDTGEDYFLELLSKSFFLRGYKR